MLCSFFVTGKKSSWTLKLHLKKTDGKLWSHSFVLHVQLFRHHKVLTYLLPTLCSDPLSHIFKIKITKNQPCERTCFPLCLWLCSLHRAALDLPCPWPPSLHSHLHLEQSCSSSTSQQEAETFSCQWPTCCSLAGSCTCWVMTQSPECKRAAKTRRKIAALCSQ